MLYFYNYILLYLFLVFVFTPNSKNIVYKKQNIFGKNNENTSILWTLFAPKSDRQCGQNSSWLDNSTLYMLTNQQVIIVLNMKNIITNEILTSMKFTNIAFFKFYVDLLIII